MSSFDLLPSVARELARKINEEAKADPNSPYTGKYVGIVNGQVVGSPTVGAKRRSVFAKPSKCCCIEASADYDDVHQFWSAD